MPWKKKHRERKSPRTKGWDYGQTASYFITICTKNRKPYFGKINNGMMGLSRTGLVVNWIWQQIPRQFPHVQLDEYIVMPNHIHGILTIYDERENNRDAINRVPMGNNSINQPGGVTGRHNPMLSKGNLGQVIRWYKGRCTYEIHPRYFWDFQWQGRYWDHIIKDDEALARIRKYINDNPLTWENDRLYGND